MTIARGAGIPMVLVNDLIVAGHDIGRTALELEADVVAHGDARRGGGTWMGGLDHDLEVIGRPVTRTRTPAWSWAEPDDEIAGRVTAGGGFIRCLYEPSTTPVGPSTGPMGSGLLGLRRPGVHVAPAASPRPDVTTGVRLQCSSRSRRSTCANGARMPA